MICPHCSNENPPEARFCATCGKDMTMLVASNDAPTQPFQSPAPGSGGYSSGPSYAPAGHGQQAPQSAFSPSATGHRRKGPAVAALIIGLFSFFTASFFLIGALVGLVFGMVVIVKIKKRPAEYSGTGMAITGVILSVFSIGVGVVVFLALVLTPRVARSSRAANETIAIGKMRTIASAEAVFHSTHESYAGLEELRQQGLLGFSSLSNGYRFEVTASDDGFQATATPEHYGKYGTGLRSFFLSEDNVIHAADKSGLQADSSDPPLE